MPGLIFSADFSTLNVTSSAAPHEIVIGKQIEFRVTVEHDRGLDIFYPDESANLSPFELLGRRTTSNNKGALQVTEIAYTLTSFETGDFLIPSIIITAKDRLGNERNVRTVEHRIAVRMGTALGSEIKDIAPPMEMHEREGFFKKAADLSAYIAAVLLMIIILIAFLLRSQKREMGATIDIREVALCRLNMLKDFNDNEIETLFLELSDILRNFLHDHMDIDSHRMTSAEIVSSIGRISDAEKVAGRAEELFSDIDLVKFSPFIPSAQEAGEAILRAERLIRGVP